MCSKVWIVRGFVYREQHGELLSSVIERGMVSEETGGSLKASAPINLPLIVSPGVLSPLEQVSTASPCLFKIIIFPFNMKCTRPGGDTKEWSL